MVSAAQFLVIFVTFLYILLFCIKISACFWGLVSRVLRSFSQYLREDLLVCALSPLDHKRLHQGWKQT